MPPPARRSRSFSLPWPRARGCGKRCADYPPRGRFNHYRWTHRRITSSKAACPNSPACPALHRYFCLQNPRSPSPRRPGRCRRRARTRIGESGRRRQPGRERSRRAGREAGPGRQAGSGISRASEKNQPPHALHFRPTAVSRRRPQQAQSPIAVRKEALVRLVVERAPLSKAGKPSREGRRSARSGGNHRWRENLPPILRPGVSRRRPRKVREKRLVDRKGAMPRCAVKRGRKSASVRGQRDQGGSGQPPGLGPAPSHRSALQKDLASLGRLIDRAAHLLIEQNGGGQRVPAVLRGLLRLGDALPDSRPLLFAPNQEDRGPGDPDDRDQDPDQDRNQDEPDLDSDPDGRMDDPVARLAPRAPATLPAGRLGLPPGDFPPRKPARKKPRG
jgi:hypothetical protein